MAEDDNDIHKIDATVFAKKLLVTIPGALVAPVLVYSLCLWCSERYFPGQNELDYFFYFASIACGVAVIFFMPFNWFGRIGIAIPYVLLYGYYLFIYTFYFMGIVYGKWL